MDPTCRDDPSRRDESSYATVSARLDVLGRRSSIGLKKPELRQLLAEISAVIDEIAPHASSDPDWEVLLQRAAAVHYDYRYPRVSSSQARKQMALANKKNAKRAKRAGKSSRSSSNVWTTSAGLPSLGKKRH